MNALLSGISTLRSEKLFTHIYPRSALGNVVQFPLTRIFIVALFLLPVAILHNLFVDNVLFRLPEIIVRPVADIERIVNFILFILAYRIYTNIVENRQAYELSAAKAPKEFGIGFLISLMVVGIVVAVMELLGFYHIESANSPLYIIHCFFKFGMGAFVQRLLFTLILFRLIEEFAGSWSAMIAVALIFGFAHIGNENATVWTSVSLVISDGILMAAAYMLTRRIWLVWGLHAGWNYFQDGIFGMPNSGITSLESWLNPVISGPAWVTGSSFGIEASVMAVLLNLGVGIVILRKAVHHKLMVQPAWKRKPLRLKY